MATILTHGYCVTQNKNFNVIITRGGKAVLMLCFSRPLSGEELEELAFYARTH